MARPQVNVPLIAKYWSEDGSGNVTAGPTFTTSNNGGNPMFRDRRVWTGSVTPGFKSKKSRERKTLAPLAHSVDYARWKGTAYIHTTMGHNPPRVGSTTYQKCNTTAWSMGVPVFGHLSEAYNTARSRAAGKVSEMHMNLAQAFAERKQTADLLADTAVRVTALARALKRGDPQGLMSALASTHRGGGSLTEKQMQRFLKTPADKRLSTHWLELQYGWKPLLQDAFGAAQLLADHITVDNFSHVVHGSAKAHEHKRGGNGAYDNPIWSLTNETRCKMGIQYRLNSEDRARLAQTGIDNPALLAWELVPYSFVVDWFLPVGNYLQALNAFAGFSFVRGWISYKTEQWYTNEYTGKVTGSSIWQSRTGFGELYRARYERSVLDTFPGAGFPTFKNPIGGEPLNRFLTAYSLLRVLFK